MSGYAEEARAARDAIAQTRPDWTTPDAPALLLHLVELASIVERLALAVERLEDPPPTSG